MAHFYGKLYNHVGPHCVTRTGSKTSGIVSDVASYSGGIRVSVTYDSANNVDRYRIEEIPWQGAGRSRVIAEGVIGKDD